VLHSSIEKQSGVSEDQNFPPQPQDFSDAETATLPFVNQSILIIHSSADG